MDNFTAVVLADPDANDNPQQTQAMAAALSKSLALVPYDALRLVRDAHGILVEDLTWQSATRVVEALGAIGILAGTVDGRIVPSQTEPVKIRLIEVSPVSLKIQTGYTGMSSVPWNQVALVGVCRCRQTTHTKIKPTTKRQGSRFGRMAAGLIGGPVGSVLYAIKERSMTSTTFTHQVESNEFYAADLHVAGGILRIHSNECLYNYLGDRVLERSEMNFHTVLCDIARISPPLLFSPPAMRFVEGANLADEAVDNLHHFEEYNRWLFLAAKAFSNPELPSHDSSSRGESGSVLDEFSFE